MKALMILGEYAVGVVILLMVLACIFVAAFISLFELPGYLRRMHQ